MAKRYYGVHLGHDANIAIFNEDGELDFFSQAERVCRQKNARPGYSMENFGGFPWPTKEDVTAIVAIGPSKFKLWKAGHSFDTDIERQFQENGYTHHSLGANFALPKYSFHHHLCHVAAAWMYRSDNKKKFCLAYDGAGHDAKGDLTCYLGGYISDEGFERVDITPIPSSAVFSKLLGSNSPGKAMGLAGYFESTEPINHLDFLKFIENSCGETNNFLGGPPQIQKPHDDEDLIFVAKLYKFWIDHIWNAIELNIKQHRKPDQGVLIGGGTTLSLELNTRIWNMCKNVTFCPATDDSGLSIGAAAYCYFQETGKWPKALLRANLQHVHVPNPKVGPQSPQRVARLIANGKIVALVRGDAEAGPRALGFRSLLARADKEFNLPKISQHIKGREHYRPLSPMVTSDTFSKYFVGPMGEFMQYRVHCNELCQKELPAIVHKDLSSRPQVVFAEKDPWLYTMLQEYEKLTGHTVVINTSLNSKGMPICNTLKDVKSDMMNKNVEIISL